MTSLIRKAVKTVLLQGVFVAAVATTIGFQATGVSAATVASRLWSVAVHIEYQDGSVYENVVMSGLPAQQMAAALAECGRSHWTGSVVRFHCFPMPE